MIRSLSRFIYLSFLLVILSSCVTKPEDRDSFVPPDESPPDLSIPFYNATQELAFEDEDRFVMVEGSECVQRDHGPGSATMLIFIEMPDYVDRGTVVLNGWDLRYLNGDHEIRQIRADITHSKLVTGGGSPNLVFEVQGEISDQNWDDDYEFCVYYTAIGYNSTAIDAVIEGDYSGITAWALQREAEGPVSTLETIWTDGSLKSGDSAAVIPRGFNFQYDNEAECEWRLPFPCKWEDPADHHLIQVAYSLFQTGASPNPDGNLHWVTQTIFKDNSIRAHWIEIRASLIGGTSVELRADFLPLNPRSGGIDICRSTGDGKVRTETVRVDDLPFDYAVPMLTGWDLNYECDDQHVERVGIWIHDIHFDPATNGLEYQVSSILRDDNGNPDFNADHRITILGLNRVSGPPLELNPD